MLIKLFIFLTFATQIAHAQTPGIVAGIGKSGYSGDGLPAVVAQLRVPSDVFVTPEGHLYIADTSNNRIRRVDKNGKMETVAGNGERVISEDGGIATEVGIMSPSSVVVDGSGNLYFTEWTSHRVRVVTPEGRISTIAGNGESTFNGDGKLATETALSAPSRIFLDGKGNLYIAEWSGNRVRVVGSDGRVKTVAGSGEKGFGGDGGPATEAEFDRPNGLFVTSEGNIYISDLGNNRIRRVGSDGIIQTIAGDGRAKYLGDGGPATEASLNTPSGLFVDASGSIYVCDSRNKKVRKIDPSGTISTWVHGLITKGQDEKPERKPLRNPNSVFVDTRGHIYISDGSMNAILRFPSDAEATQLPVSAPGVVGYSPSGGFLKSILDLF